MTRFAVLSASISVEYLTNEMEADLVREAFQIKMSVFTLGSLAHHMT